MARPKTYVLAGNPNVGKSVFFNAFTGLYVNVSNFPGTTVDVPKGKFNDETLLKDTPGVYGLSCFSEEEQVAEKTILAADIVINVVSAISLERDLFLTQQLIDYGKPIIVALNQMDEAEARNIRLDIQRLIDILGVPVIPTIAVHEQGMKEVRNAVASAKIGNPTPGAPEPQELIELEKDIGHQMKLYGLRRHHVNAIVSQVVERDIHQANIGKRVSKSVGQLLLNPWIGFLSMLFVLLALYQVIGVWVAGDLVKLVESGLMLQYVIPFMQQIIGSVFPVNSPLYTLLGGEFGVLTMSVQYIFGVLFPLVLGFYIYISLLEDCGYLPRIAVLSDGVLSKVGLNGRAVIPLILGLGCVTMATVSTRVLTSQRERTIASTILAITIPCSAQLGVIMGLMALAGGLKGWAVFCGILVSILLVLGTILDKILPGKSSALVMDLPPMRVPSLKNIAIKTWIRTKGFIWEAAPLFMLGSLLVAVCQVTGLLAGVQEWLKPVTVSLLHLPAETAQAFIMGMVRRDFGAAGLLFLSKQMNPVQIMTSLIVITLFVPCIASATVIWKERGIKETAIVLIGSWVLAFGMGALVARVLEVVPILG
ncbi:MAG: ferrous iron transporter B [Cyanobacteria bacterium]|nr:ferrous iron transporter B [Cyanobacteriota bacterium]